MTPLSSNIINLPISEASTPNQRRIRLFNINQPLELLIEEFDKEWWPLIPYKKTEYVFNKICIRFFSL